MHSSLPGYALASMFVWTSATTVCSAQTLDITTQDAWGTVIMKSNGGATTELVAVARAELARRLSITEQHITLIEAVAVTWSDTSLGCPHPGMSYAQRLVPGTRIVLRAHGERYHYHAGLGRGPFYCETPTSAVDDADPRLTH